MESNSYLEFENKFRGDRKNITETLSSYDLLIERAIKNIPLSKLIDIGCGRGEWLEKCQDKFDECLGIESDIAMIKICRDYGLNVLQGDAVDKLNDLEDKSVSVITIFHMIEHIEHSKLIMLLNECLRVLCDDGILIMETPSIDNLLVSSKTFYLDPTHINPINPDSISFYIEKIGFSNVKYYYINGGPLQDADPLKLTRVLNGVAQDLCIIATKKKIIFDKIFNNSSEWESQLNVGKTLLETAIDHDLKLESTISKYKQIRDSDYKKIRELNSFITKFKSEIKELNSEIKELNNEYVSSASIFNQDIELMKEEINLLKARLKYFLYFLNFLKFFLRPFFVFLKLVKKFILKLCSNIFNMLLNMELFRSFISSEKVLSVITFSLRNLLGTTSNIYTMKIQNKIDKTINRDKEFSYFNKKLLLYYNQSNSSKKYKELYSKRHK